MATFSQRLEEALEQCHMKPAELSRLTGIGEGAISQYRKGAYKASQKNLSKIAEALQVPMEWLAGNDNKTDELISLYMHGVLVWINNFRFSAETSQRLKEHFQELLLRYKNVIEAMSGCDEMNDYLQRELDSLEVWVRTMFKYVQQDYSETMQERCKQEWIDSYELLSERDKIAWLTRVEDYIQERKLFPDEE